MLSAALIKQVMANNRGLLCKGGVRMESRQYDVVAKKSAHLLKMVYCVGSEKEGGVGGVEGDG